MRLPYGQIMRSNCQLLADSAIVEVIKLFSINVDISQN